MIFDRYRSQIAPVVAVLALSAGAGTAPAQQTLSSPRPAAVESVAPANSFPDAPSHSLGAEAQPPAAASQVEAAQPPTVRGLPLNFLRDELAVVTSPARLRKPDLVWLLPLAGAGAAAIATDTSAMRNVVSHDAGFNSAAGTSSDVLRGVFIGVPLALYGGGLLAKNERARETGLLGGEAMIDAYVAGLAIKYVTLRERPSQHNAGGAFFSGDAVPDPSFVSGHSVVVWSSAAVLAAEYNKPWQQAAIYTLATGGSLTRVLARQHFPADALLGSATGWLIGHYVYRVHHHFVKR